MILRKNPAQPVGPGRPSHFGEDPNQRTDLNESTLDYPDTDLTPDSPDDYGMNDPVESVPVHLTTAPPNDRTLRDWSAGTLTVNTVRPAQVGGSADRGRKRIVVRNLDDANSVFAVRSSTDQNYAGYEIPAGAEVEFFHNHSLWLRAETADVEVTFFAEFDVAYLSEN